MTQCRAIFTCIVFPQMTAGTAVKKQVGQLPQAAAAKEEEEEHFFNGNNDHVFTSLLNQSVLKTMINNFDKTSQQSKHFTEQATLFCQILLLLYQTHVRISLWTEETHHPTYQFTVVGRWFKIGLVSSLHLVCLFYVLYSFWLLSICEEPTRTACPYGMALQDVCIYTLYVQPHFMYYVNVLAVSVIALGNFVGCPGN